MNNKYIIDFEPKFLSENKNNGIEELIEKAIYLSLLQLNYDNLKSLDIKNTPLTNKCDLVRNKLGKILKKTDLAADIVYLETQDILGNDVVGHSILVVILEDNIYLVDPTYSQFFLKENCHLSKYLINSERKLVILAPDPGYYYLNNKEDEPEKENHLKTLVSNLTQIQKDVINSLIVSETNNLSVRSKNAILHYLENDFSIENFAERIFLQDTFNVLKIKKVGKKSAPEMKVYLSIIKDIMLEVSETDNQEDLTILKNKLFIQHTFSGSAVKVCVYKK